MNARKALVFAGLALAALVLRTSYADTVELKNGKVYHGRKISTMKDKIAFKSDGKLIFILKSDIKNYTKGGGAAGKKAPGKTGTKPEGEAKPTNAALAKIADWKERLKLGGNEQFLGVRLSADGSTALSATDRFAIILWDIKNGKEVSRFGVGDSEVKSFAFAADGEYFVTGHRGGAIRVSDVKGKEIYRVALHRGRVDCVAMSPDGKLVISSSGDNTTRLYDVEQKQGPRKLDIRANAAAVSPDGKKALLGTNDSLILVDAASGKDLRK